jgi:hypothetical protein
MRASPRGAPSAALALLCALLLAGCAAAQSEVSVFRIARGDCFDDAPAGTALEQVDVVACEEPHDNEVFAVVEHPAEAAAAFPGSDAIVSYAESACTEPYRDYVGTAYERSRYSIFPIVPSAATWERGDRQIVCALYDHEAGPVTGSVRDSAR